MKKLSFLIVLLLWVLIGVAQDANEDLYRKGEDQYFSGKYTEAIGTFSQVLAADPNHLNAYLQRGFCHVLLKDHKNAIADFTALLERKNDHIWAYTSRGSAYNKIGEYELAMSDFNQALALDPENEEAYNNRGWTKKFLGDQKGACKDWHASQKMGNAEARIILTNNYCN